MANARYNNNMPKPNKKNGRKPESITYTQSFAAVVSSVGMKKKLIIKSPRWYQHQINKFKDGEEVTIQVHNRRPKRTEAQNRYYWGAYLPLIAEETGEKDLDRLHELFKGKFLTQGVVDVLGQKVRMKKSTTELGVGEFCQYIIDIESETGIASPPTESFGIAPIQHYDSESPIDK